MPQKKEEEVFYVGVKDPIELRRSILESSKEILQYSQRAEKFKEIRKEKGETIAKLKGQIAEIHRMINKARSSLPKTNIRARMHMHEEKAVEKVLRKEEAKMKKVKKAEEKPAKEMTELEKLESELGEIESKLGRMA